MFTKSSRAGKRLHKTIKYYSLPCGGEHFANSPCEFTTGQWNNIFVEANNLTITMLRLDTYAHLLAKFWSNSKGFIVRTLWKTRRNILIIHKSESGGEHTKVGKTMERLAKVWEAQGELWGE